MAENIRWYSLALSLAVAGCATDDGEESGSADATGGAVGDGRCGQRWR
jgi:hypothetical protein